jgi:hypothetical protein
MPAVKDFLVLLGEIVAHDADETYGSEEAGGHSEIRRCAADGPFHFSVRAFHRVERHGTHNE